MNDVRPQVLSPELMKVLSQAKGPSTSDLPMLLKEAEMAAARIATRLAESPLRRSDWLSNLTGAEVWLKLECLNPTGSFKVRGALNAISQRMARRAAAGAQADGFKIVAASAGNHAQGVAFAARVLGCEAHIFLPRRTPLVKRTATARLGARVYLEGDVLEETFEAAVAFAGAQGAEFVHAFNDFDIIAGQASCALEALKQLRAQLPDAPLRDVDFLCSVGGGGLAAGVGMVWRALMPGGRVFGAEQENYDALARSLASGTNEKAAGGGYTIADGICVRNLGNLSLEYMRAFLERAFLVDDDAITASVLGLCERERVVAEGAGAAAVAALQRYISEFKGRKIIVCVSGGNVDPQLLSRMIVRGLGVTGRLLRISVPIGDRPGQLKALLEAVAETEANVLEVFHDRTYSQVSVGNVEVELALETRDEDHQYSVTEKLQERGFHPKIP